MRNPEFSVIVPAFRAAHLLPDTLGALAASDLPREWWELIVVDDASGDNTATVAAEYANRVIALVGRPSGPGSARNIGAKAARGSWLVFVDADVRVHRDTLSRIAAHATAHPELVAMFGAYDAHPAAHGLLSEYRNLLHRQVHCAGAGETETFWAGCGAVRRDAFEAVSGFDVARFARPSIEDIELGYRLRDRGGRILLDPSIQGTHLKRWSFFAMLRTDIRDRGVPWMRLLLERRNRTKRSLNTGPAEQLKVLLVALAAVLLVASLVLRDTRPGLVAAVLLLAVAAGNAPTYAWFATQRGWPFALCVVPLHLLYYVCSTIAAAIGVSQYLVSNLRPRAEK